MTFVFGVLFGLVMGFYMAVILSPEPEDFEDEEETNEYYQDGTWL